MSIHFKHLVFLSALALGGVSCAFQTANAATQRLSFDFNASPTWKGAKPYASAAALGAKAQWGPVGSYDTAGSATQSGGWRLSADASKSPKKWSAGLVSGALPFSNTETNLGKLTLAFTLSANANRPVKVKIASLSAKGARTGGLETLVYPAAPDFLQRYALDLNTFKPSGAGKFDPKAPQIQLAFEMDSSVWPSAKNEIRVDNVNLSGPAFYVSPNGQDENDGKTEQTAFKTPQKALDTAQEGDIVLLMDGTYKAGQVPVANFVRAGTPAAWIVVKNYPGHHPILTSTGWNIVGIAKGSNDATYSGPPLGYIEIRGLHIRGEGDVARQKYPDAMDKPDPRTNSNGIAIDSRYSVAVCHDIRIADNLVDYVTAMGIGGDADWLTIENNVCNSNCWTNIYASSGISVSGPVNFDAQENIYKRLIRNNVCCHNQNYEMWVDLGRYSDGNGIILDVNQGHDPNSNQVPIRPPSNYIGRTLVQSNLCYDNGGSGIHTVQADHVDIINNTVYLNSASVHLEYSEMFTYASKDVHFINNILVAPIANLAAGEKPEPVNAGGGNNVDVVFSHNLYFGGNIAPHLGEGDRIADPTFTCPTIDSKVANFRLNFGSPANGAGLLLPFTPYLNLDGQPRGARPNIGAY